MYIQFPFFVNINTSKLFLPKYLINMYVVALVLIHFNFTMRKRNKL